MIVDLVMLTIIGCVLEGLATKMSGLVFKACPSFTFSFLIVFIAVVRWHGWGLIIIPLLPIATIVGGQFNDIPYLSAVYGWQIYLSSVIALLPIGLNIIFFKKYGTKKVVLNNFAVIGLLFLGYLLYMLIFNMSYRIMTSGNPIVMGSIPYEAMLYDTEKEEMYSATVNLCYYVERTFIYNLFGLIIAFVGIFILRSQGVVNYVIDKLIDDKKNAELDKLDEENFKVLESDETMEAEVSESINKDS